MCAMVDADVMRASTDDVRSFGDRLLRSAGFVPHEASTIADLLVETSLRGVDSHGVVRFPIYARRCRAGGIVSPAPLDWIVDSGAVALLDAGSGAGQVAAMAAMERSIALARAHGVAAVGVRHSNHMGALASYADRIASAGLYGIVTTNASPQIAPTGGAEGLLGNNPIAIGAPAPGDNIVLDMANSVAARGKIRLHMAAGTPLPEGWARDAAGRPTTDPQTAMDGLLEPIAGPKGYGLVLMLDLLCGILTGSRSSEEVGELTPLDRPTGVGHFFLAIDIARFGSLETFGSRVATLRDRVHAARRAPGIDELYLPGEIEDRTAADRQREGLPMSRPMLADFRAAATECGVDVPDWIAAALA